MSRFNRYVKNIKKQDTTIRTNTNYNLYNESCEQRIITRIQESDCMHNQLADEDSYFLDEQGFNHIANEAYKSLERAKRKIQS